jgi:hypothetical protein
MGKISSQEDFVKAEQFYIPTQKELEEDAKVSDAK